MLIQLNVKHVTDASDLEILTLQKLAFLRLNSLGRGKPLEPFLIPFTIFNLYNFCSIYSNFGKM